MVNSDVARMEYTTVAGVTEYAIGFQYLWNNDDTPQIMVYTGSVANTPLVYGTDYTISQDGLSIVLAEEPEVGTKLVIVRDVPFTQTSDYTIGRIDPDQIERDLDLIVMREQEINVVCERVDDSVNDISDELSSLEHEVSGLQTSIDNKQDTISDLAAIRAGASAGATAVQPSDLSTVATSGSYNDLSNKPTLGTAAAENVSAFATAAQGAKADTAVQPGALATVATSGSYNDLSNKPTLGTAAAASASDFATAAQGAKADTAVQSGDLAQVATSGSYNDLLNKPTIPSAQVNSDWNANSGVAQILNKPILGTAASADTTDFATAAQGAKIDDVINQAGRLVGVGLEIKESGTNTREFMVDAFDGMLYISGIPTSGGGEDGAKFILHKSGALMVSTQNDAPGSFGMYGSPADTIYVNKISHGTTLGNDIQVPNVSGTMLVATPPTTDGTYVLKATVLGGTATYTWVAE